jgi:hypothetical protein
MSKKLVPINVTYLFSMKGSACVTWTLRGMFPLRVQGLKLQRLYGRHCLVSDANCGGKRLIMRKREPAIGSIIQVG